MLTSIRVSNLAEILFGLNEI